MDQSKLIEQLGQADARETGGIFREYLRGAVRAMIADVMGAEVDELCGVKYHPDIEAEHQRAGSADGLVVWQRQRENVLDFDIANDPFAGLSNAEGGIDNAALIKRPRVRRKRENGSSEEVRLKSYESARRREELHTMVFRELRAGVSSRKISDVHPESPGVSKSNVSRLWIEAGAKQIAELRSRDIASRDWLVMMFDGIVLSKEQTAIVAIGVASGGTKHVLDFAMGSTENYEVCRDLVGRIVARDFAPKRRLLVVLDGSAALKKAALKFFPNAVIQRCLVHKEHNLCGYLSKRDWGEVGRLFKRLRDVQGKEAAEEVYAELETFLSGKNAEALKSFHEAGAELIALHSLEVPATLHKSLLSTNLIENSFRNTRRKLGHVTRFRAETDQASRWLAFALLEVEKGFRRLQGWRDLPSLAEALERPPEASRSTLAPERRLSNITTQEPKIIFNN